MKEFVEKEKNRIEEFLKDSMEHQDKKVDYILYKSDTNETNTLCSNSSSEEAIEFTPITKNYREGYSNVPEWDFNFDYYIYNLLEEGWQIGYMTPEVHYSIWNSIHELYPEDIDYKDGVQNYLQYCADNGITKEFLDKNTELDTPDIMNYFEGLALFETMEYKGYIIEADDVNFDNDKENLVNIYESKRDYENKESIETVSLNTIGLKQNIKEYIDETYMMKDIDVPSERAYLNFVLGYDFLQDMLKNSDNPECDISYDFCDYVSAKFMKSEEYRNTRYSTYEMLEQWIRDNKNLIQYEYNDFIGKEYESYNDMTVLLTGDRNGQPIVLVERVVDEKPEYIIGINYEIKDNNLSWGYGYYYSDDIKKALNDYQKVIEGGNLADTFVKKEELKIKLVGIDSWDRPVYKDKEGNLYKDVNLGRGELDLHTAVNNDFYGEPDSPISDDIKVSVIKSFNKNKDRER
ncbi:MAG: hypothetical protein IJY25_00910 [Bacilli bacterium]|nr:hypothetical protein [Clostridia bacterium]MBQ9071704.1 hypothetical protein [Bacilli bacterium]